MEIDSKWLCGETAISNLYGFAQGSEDWIRARYIGGSVICELMGLSKYSTPEQALLNVIHPKKLTMNSTIFRGLLGEDFVRSYVAKKMGLNVRQIGMAVSKTQPWMRASPDGIYDLPGGGLGILEIKILSSKPRRLAAMKVVDDLMLGTGPVGDSIFTEHYHQVQYTAGVIGAIEITYVVLTCSTGEMDDPEDRIIVRRFRANSTLYKTVHVPAADAAYFKLLKRRQYGQPIPNSEKI